MLHFCLGDSGSGKSTYMYKQIKKISEQTDNNIILLIPDQHSFESEKRLYHELKSDCLDRVNVFTFERLSREILSESEETYSKNTDSRIRLLIMALAVKEVSDALSVYSNQSEHVSFYKDMLELIKELQTNGISPYDFEKAYNKLDESTVMKAKDISLIYSAYEASLESHEISSVSEIELAALKSRDSDYLKDKTVFIDEFYLFSSDKYMLLEEIIKASKEVYINICIETRDTSRKQLFSSAYKTYNKLKKLCEDNFCDYDEIREFESKKRFTDNGLLYFSENIFKNRIDEFQGENTGVLAVAAPDVYQECDYVCAQIRQLIINNGYRYKDVAIVGRNTAEYTNALESALSKYEIPAFFDTREPVLKKAPAVLCTSAFEITGFNTENILKFLKTGYTDISSDDILLLENYCYIRNVNGSLWLNEFTDNKEYRNDTQKIREEKALNRLNVIRKRIVESVNKFRFDTESANGSDICRSLYKFVIDMGIVRQLNKNIDELIKEKNETQARQLEQIWNIIVDTIDVMYKLIGEKKISRSEFSNLFKQILSESNFAVPPQHIDEVTVGNAANIRLAAPKVVFLIGVNDNVFPMSISNGLLFSAYERKKIYEEGIDVYCPNSDEFWNERFIFYKAATAPSEKLYLTYSELNSKYNAMYPSIPIMQYEKMFGEISVKSTDDFDEAFYCSTKSSLFEHYAKSYFDNTPEQSAKRNAVNSISQDSVNADLLESASKNIEFNINNKTVSDKLTGKDIYLSATRIEQYYSCRFAHFCKYGLDLKPLEKIDINSAETGKVLHYCMEMILKEHLNDIEKFNKQKAKELAKTLIDNYIEEKCGGSGDKSHRYKNLMGRLSNRIANVIMQIKAEFEQSKFVPCDFEVEIGPDGKIEPMILETKDGRKITVGGVIDRADIYDNGENKYIRIVDYKSNGKKFDLNLVYEGLDLQMLLYLFIISRSKNGKYNNLTPAGILYYSLATPKDSKKKNKTDEEKSAVLKATYQMNGIVLNNEEIISAMEEDKKGIFIPKCDKRNAASFATLEELEKIQKYCEKLLTEMIEEYLSGKIDTNPVEISNYKNSCTYCPYSEICGRKDEINLRTINKLTVSDFYNLIERRVETDEQN